MQSPAFLRPGALKRVRIPGLGAPFEAPAPAQRSGMDFRTSGPANEWRPKPGLWGGSEGCTVQFGGTLRGLILTCARRSTGRDGAARRRIFFFQSFSMRVARPGKRMQNSFRSECAFRKRVGGSRYKRGGQQSWVKRGDSLVSGAKKVWSTLLLGKSNNLSTSRKTNGRRGWA